MPFQRFIFLFVLFINIFLSFSSKHLKLPIKCKIRILISLSDGRTLHCPSFRWWRRHFFFLFRNYDFGVGFRIQFFCVNFFKDFSVDTICRRVYFLETSQMIVFKDRFCTSLYLRSIFLFHYILFAVLFGTIF